MSLTIDLRPTPYDAPDAHHLTAELEAEQRTRYSRVDPAAGDPSDYEPPLGLFLIAYLEAQAVACGGYRQLTPSSAEIKKMFVRPTYRGQGIGRLILTALEEHATHTRAHRILLETGVHNTEAISLYTRAGYAPIPGYTPGRDPAINRAYAKTLPGTSTSHHRLNVDPANRAASSTFLEQPGGGTK